MLLKSMHLENIRSYLDEQIEFPAGSTLLSGDVGCGKSTVLLSMDFALFGLRKGELEGGDLLRHGKDSGSVELAFEVDGSEIKIKRTLKRSKDSVVQDSGIISINGRESELMPVELKSRVLELFGYSQEILKKNRPIFRYTVYTPQERMKDILFDADSRLSTLRKIFSFDKYGQIKANTKLLVTELRTMKRENEASSRDLEQKTSEREEKENEKRRMLAMLDKHSIELSAIDLLMKEKQEGFELIRKKMNESASAKQKAAKVDAEIRVKSARLQRVEKELSEINEKLSASLPVIQLNIGGIRREIADLEGKKEIIISEHAVLSSELVRLGDVLKKGVCSFCGQHVANRDDFQKHLNDKNHIHAELKTNMEFASAKIKNLRDQMSQAEKIEAEKRLITEYRERKSRMESERTTLAAEVCALSDELAMLISRDDKNLEGIYASAQNEINNLNKTKLALEKEKSRCEQQLYDAEKFLTSIEKEIEKKRAAREKIIYINELVNWLDAYFVNLMNIIEKHVMSAVQLSFNEFFQKWFAIIMGDQFAVRVDEDFAPVIEQNGYRTEYANLSGGEKTAIALAYRLALNRVINSMIDTIKTKDILILDEPTDGFSSEQLDRIRDVIAELQLKQVILVSHEPKIDTFVDNVIKIYKENHISKVAY